MSRLRFLRVVTLVAPVTVLAAMATVASSATGCSGCRNEHPYVPFLADSSATPKVDGGVALVVDSSVDGGKAPTFQAVRASLAPPNTTKWALEGISFEAPPGQLIIAGVARDLDGDGRRDVAAYMQPAAGGGGELRYFHGDEAGGLAPSKVVGGGQGNDLSVPSPCQAKPTMTLVGPHTITLDLRPSCGDAAPAPRRFVLVAFAPTPSLRFSARISEAPAGWTFTVDVDAPDRDGDGVDDPTFAFGLEGGGPPYEPGERIVARLRYWDRPAGLSRDRTEPEASFQQIAQQATARAAKKATAAAVPALVRRLRLLHSSLCSEAGGPWIDVGGDHGVGCGASRGMEDAGAAEVKAHLVLGDVLSAIVARERLAGAPVTKTSKTRETIDKLILAAAPAIWATQRELRAIPNTPAKGAPAWGALAFEKSGTLLVRTATSVQRIDPITLDDGDASDVGAWSWEVGYPSKDARLASVLDACEAPYMVARVSGHDVPTGATLVPLPLLPPLFTSRCGDGKAGASAQTTPVAWGPSGLFALVDDEPVIVPLELVTASGKATGTLPAPAAAIDGAFTLGAPRSPNGQWLVVPTRFGIVRRDDTTRAAILIRNKELEGLYGTLRECAINNEGTRLACVHDGKVVLFDASSGSDSDAGN